MGSRGRHGWDLSLSRVQRRSVRARGRHAKDKVRFCIITESGKIYGTALEVKVEISKKKNREPFHLQVLFWPLDDRFLPVRLFGRSKDPRTLPVVHRHGIPREGVLQECSLRHLQRRRPRQCDMPQSGHVGQGQEQLAAELQHVLVRRLVRH